MRTPAVGDSVVAPYGAMGSFEARIVRVDMDRRQVVASMDVSGEETAFHLTFEDVLRLDPVAAEAVPDLRN